MEKLLLLGDEAIAQAAIDAGLSGVYAYPGTPSTEITEYVQKSEQAKEGGIHSQWSANEKTAYESALGMSYAGKRSMTCMKHVGLNVCADPFVNSAITGANGGMVVVVADDPSMHSSQNEQDSRVLADFAMIPFFEPSTQQEAYDMTYAAFEFSERRNIPVMIRITTRLAHSRTGVVRKPALPQNNNSLPKNRKQFILLPAYAKKSYLNLVEKQPLFKEDSENSQYNKYTDGTDKSLGIMAFGIANNYLAENFKDFPNNYPILKVGQYPFPEKVVEKMINECDKVLILEEGYPYVEKILKGVPQNSKITGRLDGTVPRTGELSPNIVADALNIPIADIVEIPDIVQDRPPEFCKGCVHSDIFTALNQTVAEYGDGRVFSDIGCYTLGALAPHNSINSCVDMGASIPMAKGASDAGFQPAVAVIGDSTFTHSGMTGLLDCIVEKTQITIVISDNSTTAMTGGQASHALGRVLDICRGLGVEEDHIRQFTASRANHEEAKNIISEELKYQGVSVIIPQRECVQTLAKAAKQKKIAKQENQR